MKISTNGLNLIKSFEGCLLTAYDIGDNMITIGWGHAEVKGNTNLVVGITTWTQSQADKQLITDVVIYENAVNGYFTRSFNQNQFDALVSFAYNLGGGRFANDGWDKTASDSWICSQLLRYVSNGSEVLPGLVRRRNAEVALYNTADSDYGKLKGEEEMTEFAILYGSGVFYVCGTKMKLLTATEWTVLRSVYSQVTQHKTGKAQEIMIMDWRNNQATFDAYVKICGGYTS